MGSVLREGTLAAMVLVALIGLDVAKLTDQPLSPVGLSRRAW
jgi:hypothetical protein